MAHASGALEVLLWIAETSEGGAGPGNVLALEDEAKTGRKLIAMFVTFMKRHVRDLPQTPQTLEQFSRAMRPRPASLTTTAATKQSSAASVNALEVFAAVGRGGGSGGALGLGSGQGSNRLVLASPLAPTGSEGAHAVRVAEAIASACAVAVTRWRSIALPRAAAAAALSAASVAAAASAAAQASAPTSAPALTSAEMRLGQSSLETGTKMTKKKNKKKKVDEFSFGAAAAANKTKTGKKKKKKKEDTFAFGDADSKKKKKKKKNTKAGGVETAQLAGTGESAATVSHGAWKNSYRYESAFYGTLNDAPT